MDTFTSIALFSQLRRKERKKLEITFTGIPIFKIISGNKDWHFLRIFESLWKNYVKFFYLSFKNIVRKNCKDLKSHLYYSSSINKFY